MRHASGLLLWLSLLAPTAFALPPPASDAGPAHAPGVEAPGSARGRGAGTSGSARATAVDAGTRGADERGSAREGGVELRGFAREQTDAGSAAAREAVPAEKRLNALLAEAQRNPAISRSPDPALKRHQDGSYSFKGNGIEAQIDADGTVHFHDKYLEGFKFDLNAWLEHLAGNDPYRSERRWFLERTQPLRDQLARTRREAAAKISGPALERELTGLWTNPVMSCERRKQETLRFWEAAPLSAQPDAQRAAIEGFVREHCADHPTCPLSVEALRAVDQRPPSRPALTPDAGKGS